MHSQLLGQRPRAWWKAFAWMGIAAVPVIALIDLKFGSLDGMLAVVGLVALASVVGMIFGIRANRPADSYPWRLVALSNAVSCVVVVFWLVNFPAVTMSAKTLGFVPIVLTTVAALHWLRRETGHNAMRVALDATLVGLGTALAGWVAFVTSVIGRTGNPVDASLPRLLGLVLDAATLTVVVHLFIARGRSNGAYPLLAVGVVFVSAAHGILASHPAYPDVVPSVAALYALPLGFGFFAAATLHPTMAEPPPRHPRQRDRFRQRFVVVAGVLSVSVLMTILVPPIGQVDRLTRIALLAALFVTVLVRSELAVGESEKRQTEARYRATHDDLTGLPNRSALYDDSSSGGPGPQGCCCLFFMDLNDFKLVNDSFGHRVGDELISLVADRVVEAVGDSGVVYRYGGDEFVVATWGCADPPAGGLVDAVFSESAARQEELAERILLALREPFALSVGRVFVSTSIGVSRMRHSAGPPNVDDLIREADSAMYHVKATKPSGYAMFDDRLRSIAVSELELSNALREAVDRREFELYYQPIVEQASGEAIAYEALLRWHLQGRLVCPEEFMSLAESTDLIVEIGEWVLAAACEQLARWRHDQPTLRVAVNISGRQLRGEALVDVVRIALEQNRLPGSALWLELTETALIEDHLSAMRVLRELVSMGVSICIDDFGTGYSALGNFQKFPIDIVKIDKSFIDAIDRNEHMFVLTSAIEALARTLGLSTVVEGVETAEQAAHVRAIGCTYAQGWHFGHPAPAGEIGRALRRAATDGVTAN